MPANPKPHKRPRHNPGISSALMAALLERDGHRCAWAGMEGEDLVPHHRSNRGMGGDRSKNRLSNIVFLPSLVNSLLESDPSWQAEAKRRGIKISGFANPELTPIQHSVHGWVLLGDDGSVSPLNAAEIAEWLALHPREEAWKV